MANRKSGRGSFWMAAGIVAGLLVYAYGFAETEVNLDRIRAEDRQERLVNIMRALARPDLIEYDLTETVTEVEIRVPCAEGTSEPSTPGDRFLQVTPPCADPRAEVLVEGFGFLPNQPVRVALVPTSAVELRLADVRTDSAGEFAVEVRLPNRPADEPQTLLARTTEPAGAPRLTQTATDTFEKIIETVFLALIATTFAIALAMPLSFFAARNLMRDIKSPLGNVTLGIIALPIGAVAGLLIAESASSLAALLTVHVLLTLTGVVVVLPLTWWLFRRALPAEESQQADTAHWIKRGLLLLASFLAGVVALYLAANLLQQVGNWVVPRLGPFAFLGAFLSTLGELMAYGTIVGAVLFGAGTLAMLANRIGHGLRKHLSPNSLRLLNLPLSMAAGLTITMVAARAIAWLYQWVDPPRTLWIPAGVGATVGLAYWLRSNRRDAINVGLGVYYFTRTVFNVLRAIEPVILAIVFVVWVGIGPFAGALALALHTIAALAKLYSEQVESISPGPLEAIRATGATRLQNVVYGVVPQIIPPYISFTMYRWDINVRMSTIIGIVGGGGIGFLLQQNINLLNYRGAAAQILAIAIVVAAMDALSSKIRERYV